MSITQRKSELRQIIHRRIGRHLTEHPDAAHAVAMGAVRRLSATMTLKELEQWHAALFADVAMEETQP